MLSALVSEREAIRRTRSRDNFPDATPVLRASVLEREAQRAARHAAQAWVAPRRVAGMQEVQHLASLCHAHAASLPDGVRVAREGLVAICGYLEPSKATTPLLLRQTGTAQYKIGAGYSLDAVVYVANVLGNMDVGVAALDQCIRDLLHASSSSASSSAPTPSNNPPPLAHAAGEPTATALALVADSQVAAPTRDNSIMPLDNSGNGRSALVRLRSKLKRERTTRDYWKAKYRAAAGELAALKHKLESSEYKRGKAKRYFSKRGVWLWHCVGLSRTGLLRILAWRCNWTLIPKQSDGGK